MTTPKLRPTLLALFAGFAITGLVLLVFDRDTGAQVVQVAESCGPQDLVVTADTVSVDPAGCDVQLVVWEAAPDAVEWCKKVCAFYPQVNPVIVTGTVPLSADLPCGFWQADVFDVDVELPAVLTREWLEAQPESWFEDLLGWEVGTRVCTPVLPPVEPTVIERPAVASAAVPVVAEPKVAG